MKWPVVNLGKIISLEYGASLPERDRYDDGSFTVLGSNGVIGHHSTALVDGPGIVVGRKGSAGKVTWIETNFWPIDTTFYVKCKTRLELRWVFYLLQFLNLERLSIITGVPGLNRNDAYQLKAPLPPLSEQRWIVEILDQADVLRRKQAETDARTERILPVLFIEMFGDPATNPKMWKTDSLGGIITETQYGTSTRASEENKGVALIRMNNIDSAGRVDLTNLKYVVLAEEEKEKYKLERGDLLFNRTNSAELVGKTGLWTSDLEAVPASYLIRFRVDEQQALPEYIWAYMNSPFVKQLLFNKARRAIGMANINAQELRALPLVLPDLEIQQAFASKLEALDHLHQRRSVAKNHVEALFQLLLHRAFSGDLTAKWREAHMQELLVEMEEQAKLLKDDAVQLSFAEALS